MIHVKYLELYPEHLRAQTCWYREPKKKRVKDDGISACNRDLTFSAVGKSTFFVLECAGGAWSWQDHAGNLCSFREWALSSFLRV